MPARSGSIDEEPGDLQPVFEPQQSGPAWLRFVAKAAARQLPGPELLWFAPGVSCSVTVRPAWRSSSVGFVHV